MLNVGDGGSQYCADNGYQLEMGDIGVETDEVVGLSWKEEGQRELSGIERVE